ncbi:MAG TPA: ATP-binding cassette domain-containing protein [Methanospirillum sp.]|uniref:ABC transporter ATP-binding protein n=1 Tax=Methanospirillum sp. TaxID=45200 RepID=UPI002CC00C86|nr:ATP-binding cassette domain-containing protein [Methanospirillum sp.]HOJ97340.1 ATP-binding cassette domain-containing protein [Methanospirillum sp.]HPP77504.1 ATP-binding cassette domain-containing protein [Methanospirillum sp.]
MHQKPLFVDFQNITVAQNTKVIIHDLSVQIPDGEHVAILGPNGSGKSTFIRTLIREQYPVHAETGRVFRIWGEEVWDVFTLRSQFGYVSHDLQCTFNRNISGREVILSGFFSSIGLFFHTITQEMENRADEICSFLEISHLAHRSFSEMSTGEARRFLIGRALVHNPRVLILDEPSNSLDLHALHMLRRMMRKITERTVIILVTHSLQDIIPEIGRVILFKDGTIYQDGPKETILSDENIGAVFNVPVRIVHHDGYYYATGY